MKISFASKKLEQLCNDEHKAIKTLGADYASKLRSRLDDIAAARVLGDIVFGKPHPLSSDRLGLFAIRLAGG